MSNKLNEIPEIQHPYPLSILNLYEPPPAILINVVKRELLRNFKAVWVEFKKVDLCSENLVASGLCGNTAILEIGNLQYLFPRPQLHKIYCFRKLLLQLNREHHRNFIIGAGKHSNPPLYDHANLTANILFEPFSLSNMEINKSSAIWWNEKKSVIEYAETRDTTCAMQGNFFLSNGVSESVFMIMAYNRYGKYDFITSIQRGLTNAQRFRNELIGLGGAYKVYFGKTICHTIPSSASYLHTHAQIMQWMKYHRLIEDMSAVGTIMSGMNLSKHCNLNEIHITHQHFHSFLKKEKGGHTCSEDTYLHFPYMHFCGTFSLAKKLYSVDSGRCDMSRYPHMIDFTNLSLI